MKVVLGLLVVANLLVFFWISQTTENTNDLAAERATNMPPLRLLSEKPGLAVKSKPFQTKVDPDVPVDVEQVEQVEQVEDKQIVTAEKSSDNPLVPRISANRAKPSAAFIESSCYALGPFAAESALKSVSSMLGALGIESLKRHETRRELNGFWVYIPPLPSRAEARKVVSMLKERGVKDYLIVPKGVKKNAISLGFFRTREGAQQHKAHMQTLGLAPVMDESYKDSSGFWLDFSSSSQPALPNALVDDLENQYDGISMKKRQCLK